MTNVWHFVDCSVPMIHYYVIWQWYRQWASKALCKTQESLYLPLLWLCPSLGKAYSKERCCKHSYITQAISLITWRLRLQRTKYFKLITLEKTLGSDISAFWCCGSSSSGCLSLLRRPSAWLCLLGSSFGALFLVLLLCSLHVIILFLHQPDQRITAPWQLLQNKRCLSCSQVHECFNDVGDCQPFTNLQLCFWPIGIPVMLCSLHLNLGRSYCRLCQGIIGEHSLHVVTLTSLSGRWAFSLYFLDSSQWLFASTWHPHSPALCTRKLYQKAHHLIPWSLGQNLHFHQHLISV